MILLTCRLSCLAGSKPRASGDDPFAQANQEAAQK